MLNILLNPIEQKIYEYVLEHPYQDMTDISLACKLHRPLAYKTIKSLIKKQFIIIQMNGKRKVYLPENPSKIYDEFVNMEFKIKNMVRDLKVKYNNNIGELKVTEYKGKYAIRSAFKEIIENTKYKNNIYRIESLKPGRHLREFYPEIYSKRASESGDIQKYVITNEHKFKSRRPSLNRYTKVVKDSDSKFDQDVMQVISDKNVLFADLNSENAFLFEGENFAEFQRNIFKILYKKL